MKITKLLNRHVGVGSSKMQRLDAGSSDLFIRHKSALVFAVANEDIHPAHVAHVEFVCVRRTMGHRRALSTPSDRMTDASALAC